VLGKNIARNVGLLAIDPIEVTLAEERKIVKPLVDLVRPA